MVKTIWTSVMLLGGSIMDIKDKSVPAGYLCIAAVGSIAVMLIYAAEGKEILLGLIPGGVLLITGRLSGCAGEADGILLILVGAMYGLREGGELIMYALLCAAVVSIFLIAFRHAGRKDTLPFIPFILAGFLLFQLRLYMSGG